MSLALDAIYAVVAAITAPWWMRKDRQGWAERFGHVQVIPRSARPRLLIHAVSVGEVNLLRTIVDLLVDRVDLVIGATTDTGIRRATELYADRCHVVRYPLDASWSVRRFLDAVQPDAVALVELELWPNFIAVCRRRSIPIAVINGRLSARSFGRYRLGQLFIGRYFRQLAFAAVQDPEYADRFRQMGVAHERCHVVGTMKWDAAQTAQPVPGADKLGAELGIDPGRPVLVAGSTAPGEHELLHRATPPGIQLICAPRRPEWFDQAAAALPNCVRRSAPGVGAPSSDRFLLDSIGELRQAYALADVVVVGRSFGRLYGSDPMEPAALGKPIVIGPAVDDFRAIVDVMLEESAIVQVSSDELPGVLKHLFASEQRRASLGQAARACVLRHQGASHRHADLLLRMMGLESIGEDVKGVDGD